EAVHEGLAELRLGRGVEVHVERLRVHGEAGEKDVVGFGHGATRLVLEHLSRRELLEELSRHGGPPVSRPGGATPADPACRAGGGGRPTWSPRACRARRSPARAGW